VNPFSVRNGFLYGLMGLPLAFVALPLYVILPNYYAREFGVPLTVLGAILLGARLFDAFIDPLLGRWSDQLFARAPAAVLRLGAGAAVVLGVGLGLLFFPPLSVRGSANQTAAWACAMLLLTYPAYSALSVSHQSWGAMLGGNETQRGQVVAWREGLGLLGVVLASVTPVALGLPATHAIFVLALCAGWLAWWQSAKPVPRLPTHAVRSALWLPLQTPAFRRLLGVFMLNGIASAIPATLVLFFIQDRLQAPAQMEPVFLGSYFLAAAVSIPLWLGAVKRLGLARTWVLGMVLAIAVFAWATQLGAGDTLAFVAVCMLSGVALGTDLALPGALLAGVIQASGHQGQAEGAYFGWWNFATKLNLALAAGLSLPLLGWFGYTPGLRDAVALQALVTAYCVVPCGLKLLAAVGAYCWIVRQPKGFAP
jgi:glycoside/pentoside/hexuronide:cation symporter, GPH family